jgi:hypothetical protein
MSPTARADRCRVSRCSRKGPTLLATVISRPSRIQATPSATIMRVWNVDQDSRSMRAGIRLLMVPSRRCSVA